MSAEVIEFHEQGAAPVLAILRTGRSLSKYEYEKGGKRLAPCIDVLRNAWGFEVLGKGEVADPYCLLHPAQFPGRVKTTDEIQSAYYNSQHWRTLRQERLQVDGGRCVLCADAADLVHHMRYHLFREELRDLISLCHDCHDRVHEKGYSSPTFPKGLPTEQVERLGITPQWPDWLTAGAIGAEENGQTLFF